MNRYIEGLCSKNKPSLVILCLIYLVDLSFFKNLGSSDHWAKSTIEIFKYTTNPKILRDFIKECYELIKINFLMYKSINIIEPCPLYEILDGLDAKLYLSGVEPSITGGKVMADRFVDQIKIHHYIRSYFRNISKHDDNMTYFREKFSKKNWINFKTLINQLLDETNKLNNTKKDKYYHNELKIYINIILKDHNNIDDIDLFIRNQLPSSTSV
jgi:hypothetical protein